MDCRIMSDKLKKKTFHFLIVFEQVTQNKCYIFLALSKYLLSLENFSVSIL